MKLRGYNYKTSAMLLCSILAAMYLHDKGGRTMYILFFRQHAGILLFFHLIFILMIEGKLHFLITPVLLYFGRISFSLYLLHQYIGLCLIDWLVLALNVSVYVAVILAAGCMILSATLVTVYLEEPLAAWLRDTPDAVSGANRHAFFKIVLQKLRHKSGDPQL